MEPRGQFTKQAAATGVAASTLPHSWAELLDKTITSTLVHILLGDGAPAHHSISFDFKAVAV